MEKFNFYIDRKYIAWDREFFSIEANTREDAINEVIFKVKEGDHLEIDCTEELYETTEYLSPKKNNGLSTIEVYESNDEDRLIWENGK